MQYIRKVNDYEEIGNISVGQPALLRLGKDYRKRSRCGACPAEAVCKVDGG